MRVAFRVIEVSPAQKPEKCGEAQSPQKQTYGNEDAQDLHQRNRNALSDTVSEDDDIAKAAMRGEQRPATASGTANRL